MKHQLLINGLCVCGAMWNEDEQWCYGERAREHMAQRAETVKHPLHYGGKDDPYEVIKVIDAWGLGFKLGNALKYIRRAGKKNPESEVEDLDKAIFYLQHHRDKLANGQESA